MVVVPKKVRTDCSSENVIVAAAQCFFRRNGADTFAGEKAHIYGSSHSNQRIEAWWSHFHRCKSGYIINLFRNITQTGVYNPDDQLEKSCA